MTNENYDYPTTSTVTYDIVSEAMDHSALTDDAMSMSLLTLLTNDEQDSVPTYKYVFAESSPVPDQTTQREQVGSGCEESPRTLGKEGALGEGAPKKKHRKPDAYDILGDMVSIASFDTRREEIGRLLKSTRSARATKVLDNALRDRAGTIGSENDLATCCQVCLRNNAAPLIMKPPCCNRSVCPECVKWQVEQILELVESRRSNHLLPRCHACTYNYTSGTGKNISFGIGRGKQSKRVDVMLAKVGHLNPFHTDSTYTKQNIAYYAYFFFIFEKLKTITRPKTTLKKHYKNSFRNVVANIMSVGHEWIEANNVYSEETC